MKNQQEEFFVGEVQQRDWDDAEVHVIRIPYRHCNRNLLQAVVGGYTAVSILRRMMPELHISVHTYTTGEDREFERIRPKMNETILGNPPPGTLEELLQTDIHATRILVENDRCRIDIRYGTSMYETSAAGSLTALALFASPFSAPLVCGVIGAEWLTYLCTKPDTRSPKEAELGLVMRPEIPKGARKELLKNCKETYSHYSYGLADITARLLLITHNKNSMN